MREYCSADHRLFARNALSGKWGKAILLLFLYAVITWLVSLFAEISSNMFSGLTSGNEGDSVAYGLIVLLVGLFVLAFSLASMAFSEAVLLGYKLWNIQLLRGETPETSVLFCRLRYLVKAFCLSFMIGLFVILWSFLFIIPGIIACYRYSQAFYIMAENPDIGVMEAISLSKKMMKGRKADLFCLNLSFIGWEFLSILTLGIGFLWLIPYMEAANASFYLDVAYNRFHAPQTEQDPVNNL